MKCAICENETTWDESYGRATFLVCPKCYNIIREEYGLKTLGFILKIGRMKEENEENENSANASS